MTFAKTPARHADEGWRPRRGFKFSAGSRRAFSARRPRLVERAQHPLLSGEVHHVPPPVVVVGLEGEGGRLSIQIDQLYADVCPVRQLAHQLDEARQVGDGRAVELDDPVLGHELVLLGRRAVEVVRDVDAAARRRVAALKDGPVRVLQDEAAPDGDVRRPVRADLARRDVHRPLPAVAQDGELDARRAEHGLLDGGVCVDGHSVHGKDQVALEKLPVRRRPWDEPLHRQHLPLLLLARDEPLRPRAAQAKPRTGHRAARHTQRDGAQLRVEQVQAAQRRRRAERPALARIVAARRAALLPRLRNLGASGKDREERLGRHALELLVELVLVAAAIGAPKGLHLAALVNEDSSDGVLEREADVEPDHLLVDRAEARHGRDADLHHARLADDALLEDGQRRVLARQADEHALLANLERRGGEGSGLDAVAAELRRVVPHEGDVVGRVEEGGDRRHLDR
mmetsp:Transcript_31168/g.98373  ORF Transcript_31168/g.98373 Transcript_31168/m.98373 type:complete len:456 (-) Transcript_31168:1034-2401(-)